MTCDALSGYKDPLSPSGGSPATWIGWLQYVMMMFTISKMMTLIMMTIMMMMTCPGDQLYQLQGFCHPLSPTKFHFHVSCDFDVASPEYLPLDLPTPRYWHLQPEAKRHHQLHHLRGRRNLIIVTILSSPAAPYRPCSAVQVGIHWSFPFLPITWIENL